MNDNEKATLYVEMWKQTIAVQQHFNDLEWRIRGLALSIITLVLGGAALAIKEQTSVKLFWWNLHLGSLVLFLGILIWGIFYFVDQVWYHRLLMGSVKHGEALEAALVAFLPASGLTKAISANSPYAFDVRYWRNRSRHFVIHSRIKLRIFYLSVAAVLAVATVAIQVGISTTAPAAPGVSTSTPSTPPAAPTRTTSGGAATAPAAPTSIKPPA